MSVTTFTNLNRHINLNHVVQYVIDNGLTLDEFKIKGEFIRITFTCEHELDAGLFEEFLGDLEMVFDEELLA